MVVHLASAVCQAYLHRDFLLLTLEGPGGVETAAWARAAGLEGFQTYYQACKYQLEDDNFEWPDGVRCVELGDGNVYKAPGVQVC